MKKNLEQISIWISSGEKKELEALAEEKGLTFSEMGTRAVRAYLYAIRSRKKNVTKR